ncbi:MAG TPA: T9SS type A sorting domain-containing protein [Bacteroidetes bacterium]|nr:T9SS type A sorting domain-containing protein [Bacteroidota bacterium]
MNKLLRFSLFFLVFAWFSNTANAQCVSSSSNVYEFFYNGTHYEIIRENKSWQSAANCAVMRGGYLAEINSQQEQDSIFYHVNQAGIIASNTVAPDGGNASYLWLGGNDLASEGDWIWDGKNTGTGPQFWQGTTAGGPIGGLYNNWGFEPDDFNGQDALGLAFTNWPLGTAGQWNDVKHTNLLYFIIEDADTLVALVHPEDQIEFNAYPNPGSGLFSVELPEDIYGQDQALIRVFDLNGQLVQELRVSKRKTHLDLTGFTNGLYFLQLVNGNVVRATEKIMLQK